MKILSLKIWINKNFSKQFFITWKHNWVPKPVDRPWKPFEYTPAIFEEQFF